jgi:hypothetical protein
MQLNKTLNNLKQTKNSFFNLKEDSPLNEDIIKKELIFYNKIKVCDRKIRKVLKNNNNNFSYIIFFYGTNSIALLSSRTILKNMVIKKSGPKIF